MPLAYQEDPIHMQTHCCGSMVGTHGQVDNEISYDNNLVSMITDNNNAYITHAHVHVHTRCTVFPQIDTEAFISFTTL